MTYNHSEKINRGFQPRLRKKLPQEFIEYADAFKIIDTGRPAPTFLEAKAAIWIATQTTRAGELPVIAVVSSTSTNSIDFSMPWYVGSIHQDILQNEDYVDSDIAPLEATILSAAEHGPNILRDAFELLVKICPIDSLRAAPEND